MQEPLACDNSCALFSPDAVVSLPSCLFYFEHSCLLAECLQASFFFCSLHFVDSLEVLGNGIRNSSQCADRLHLLSSTGFAHQKAESQKRPCAACLGPRGLSCSGSGEHRAHSAACSCPNPLPLLCSPQTV